MAWRVVGAFGVIVHELYRATAAIHRHRVAAMDARPEYRGLAHIAFRLRLETDDLVRDAAGRVDIKYEPAGLRLRGRGAGL